MLQPKEFWGTFYSFLRELARAQDKILERPLNTSTIALIEGIYEKLNLSEEAENVRKHGDSYFSESSILQVFMDYEEPFRKIAEKHGIPAPYTVRDNKTVTLCNPTTGKKIPLLLIGTPDAIWATLWKDLTHLKDLYYVYCKVRFTGASAPAQETTYSEKTLQEKISDDASTEEMQRSPKPSQCEEDSLLAQSKAKKTRQKIKKLGCPRKWTGWEAEALAIELNMLEKDVPVRCHSILKKLSSVTKQQHSLDVEAIRLMRGREKRYACEKATKVVSAYLKTVKWTKGKSDEEVSEFIRYIIKFHSWRAYLNGGWKLNLPGKKGDWKYLKDIVDREIRSRDNMLQQKLRSTTIANPRRNRGA